MDKTPILNKAVIYGGDFENLLFNIVIVVHVVAGVAAVCAGLGALLARKGGASHVRRGRVFLYAMATTAVTGIVLDFVRLSFYVAENHRLYPDTSIPSSYPARFAFGFAGFSILYMLYNTTPRTSKQRRSGGFDIIWMPALLVGAGTALTVMIYARYNPWTGGLWMIWTFMAYVIVTAIYRYRGFEDEAFRLGLHRFTVIALVMFSLWGAWQGFRPALVEAFQGSSEGPLAYTGDKPGSYSPAFWHFLRGWLPPLGAGALLFLYFVGRRARAKSSSRNSVQ